MTPQELLLKAADHIEAYGKVEGAWIDMSVIDRDSYEVFDRNCAACVVGALAVEVSDGREWSPNFVRQPSERQIMTDAIELIVSRLDPPLDGYYDLLDRVIEWSDSSTQEQVVAGLRQVAG